VDFPNPNFRTLQKTKNVNSNVLSTHKGKNPVVPGGGRKSAESLRDSVDHRETQEEKQGGTSEQARRERGSG